MTMTNPNELTAGLLRPWHTAVADPARAQEQVLHQLLGIHARTRYGAEHGASNIETPADFRRAFPVATYDDYKPLIKQVMAGDLDVLLTEEPVGWAITRGTTFSAFSSLCCSVMVPFYRDLFMPICTL